MRNVLFIISLISLSSCEYFYSQKVDSQTIYKEEQKTFSWNTIDIYPVFETCDPNASKETLKSCFETTLSDYISYALEQETVIVKEDLNDTITLKFTISKTGILQLQNFSAKEATKRAIPDIENILINSLDNLPGLLPAIKRDQPVKSAFTLPIIVEVN